jgi:aryl-alcohol dehydrogenase (NADP+)
MTRIGTSDLDVFPIGLGGNVFGFTADEAGSFKILDAWVDGGGDFIDTADGYSAWVPGNEGGESETIIGRWLAARAGIRDRVVVATKVSQHPQFPGLAPANVRAAAEASLQRLGVDSIDLYYAHYDDAETPLEATVEAFGALVADGLVRHVAVSNYTPERIEEWIALAAGGPATPIAVQPYYNLVHRNEVEEHLIPVAQRHGLSLIPYFGLEKGFLTGKYRTTELPAGASPRAAAAVRYVTPLGLAVLDALDSVAAGHGVSTAAVALAWLREQPTVAAPLASASSVDQVGDLLDAGRIRLTADEVAELSRVSMWSPPTA